MKFLLVGVLLVVKSGFLLGQIQDVKSFFKSSDDFFQTHVSEGSIDYKEIKSSSEKLDVLINFIEEFDPINEDFLTKKAFYINAYNLLVIDRIVNKYPLKTVQAVGNFFDKKLTVSNDKWSLNELEKRVLALEDNPDPRLHLVLNCGAIDCPKIVNYSYTPELLEVQLEDRAYVSLNDPTFIRPFGKKVFLSEIFKWYQDDFGGSLTAVVEFINKYKTDPISKEQVHYYHYDWALNEVEGSDDEAANSYRYITSSAVRKGGVEIKVFNNLYTQTDGSERSSFFTTTALALYGLKDRLSIGITGRYRKVKYNNTDSSPFSLFSSDGGTFGRSRVTNVGPAIRWVPSSKHSNLSVQSSLTFPLGNDLEGNSEGRFTDFDGPTFQAMLWNDISIGNRLSFFTDVGVWVEDLGFSDDNSNSTSVPLTGILSYFPHKKITIYGLLNFTPRIGSPFDYFAQAGIGFKYQMSPDFEIELLSNLFTNKYLQSVDGQAATYNIGFRYSN